MRHRSRKPVDRLAIPDDNAPLPPARRPTRWTVRTGRTIAFILLGLALAASLAGLYLTYRAAEDSAAQAEAVDRRLSVLEEDLAERTRQRDAERDAAAEEQERFRANLCVVLGQLSATFPSLDRLREALGCAESGVANAPPPVQAPAGAPDEGAAEAAPDEQSPTGPAAPPPPAEGSPAPQPPTAPAEPEPGPVTALLCGLLPLC